MASVVSTKGTSVHSPKPRETIQLFIINYLEEIAQDLDNTTHRNLSLKSSLDTSFSPLRCKLHNF